MENFLPTPDFSRWSIVDLPRGGVDFAAPLPESARSWCRYAVEKFNAGKTADARKIFCFVLGQVAAPSLKRKLRHLPVPELAAIAAGLLTPGCHPGTVSHNTCTPEAVKKAAARLLAAGK